MESSKNCSLFKIIGVAFIIWGILDLVMYYGAEIDIYWSWFGIDLYEISDFLGSYIPMIFIVMGGIIFGIGTKEE